MEKRCAIEWAQEQPSVDPEPHHAINRKVLAHHERRVFEFGSSRAPSEIVDALLAFGFEPGTHSTTVIFGSRTEWEHWYHPKFNTLAAIVLGTGELMLNTEFEDGSSVFSARTKPSNRRDNSIYLLLGEELSASVETHFANVNVVGAEHRVLDLRTNEQFDTHSEWYIVNHSDANLATSVEQLESALTSLGLDPNTALSERKSRWDMVAFLLFTAVLVLLWCLL